MADEGTAVLEPTAETIEPVEQEPQLEETSLEGVEETDDVASDSETAEETYTREQVEAERERAVAEIRAEIEAEAKESARKAERQQVEQNWQSFSADFGTRYFRDVAHWAAKQAEAGRTADEIAGMVQQIAVRGFLDRLKVTAKPYLYSEVFSEMHQGAQKRIEKQHPGWKPSQTASSNLAAAIETGDANKAMDALFEYIDAAKEESSVPAKVKAQREAEQKKQDAAKGTARLQKPGEPGPAKVGGGQNSAPLVASMNDADRLYNAGQLSHEQYKGYRQKFLSS